MKKGKRIPGHRHCPNLVRDAGKKPPPARGTTHYSRGALLSSTALLSLLNCERVSVRPSKDQERFLYMMSMPSFLANDCATAAVLYELDS